MFLKDSLVLGDEIKELGKKSTITFLGNGCGYIVNFLSTIVIGKLIGAEMYGQFTYIVSFLTFFLVVSKLGLESGIVSFLSRNTISINEKRSLLSYTLLIVGFISILFIILAPTI